ncbi:MAG: A24 family peptidase [Pseudomonas sp.]|nr:A24 family peptidase [Pseudomonas sp.]
MQSFLLFIWLAVCAVQDVQQRQIANSLTLGATVVALVYLLWNGATWLGSSSEQGVWAFFLALAFTLPGYAMGRLGADDVKLMAALGLATDNMHLLGTFIGAGIASVVWLLIAPRLWPLMNKKLKAYLQYFDPKESKQQPFAPFILVGMLLAVAWIP